MAEPPPVLYPASPDSEAKVSECAGSQFNVRVGPNYARKGNKSPSDDSMYHLSSVHMFKAESCTKHLHMATRMPLPEPLVPADSPVLPLPQLVRLGVKVVLPLVGIELGAIAKLFELHEEVAQVLLERRQVGVEVEEPDDEREHLRARQVREARDQQAGDVLGS